MDKQIDYITQMLAQKEATVKSEVSSFYPDGTLAIFSHSSEQAPLAPLLAQAKQPPGSQAPTPDQIIGDCMQIRTNIKQGQPNNAEIQLNKGRQLSDKHELPLGNTVIKVLPMDIDKPTFIFVKAGDILNASVFLGGDNAMGIMVMQNEEGNDCFLRLSEFHMLSLRNDPDPHKEVGLMTTYSWLTTKICSSVILGPSLDPIKNLLLSDWLQAEWQKAKAVASKSASKVGGGESNG